MVKGYSTPKLSKVYPYKPKKTDQISILLKIRKKPLGKMERFISAPAKFLDTKFWETCKIFSLQSPE